MTILRSDNLRPLNQHDRQGLKNLTLQAVMALYCDEEPKEGKVIELAAPSSPEAA